jgi:hypothetical protein
LKNSIIIKTRREEKKEMKKMFKNLISGAPYSKSERRKRTTASQKKEK